jgi:hypothetical protein
MSVKNDTANGSDNDDDESTVVYDLSHLDDIVRHNNGSDYDSEDSDLQYYLREVEPLVREGNGDTVSESEERDSEDASDSSSDGVGILQEDIRRLSVQNEELSKRLLHLESDKARIESEKASIDTFKLGDRVRILNPKPHFSRVLLTEGDEVGKVNHLTAKKVHFLTDSGLQSCRIPKNLEKIHGNFTSEQ